MRLLRKLVDVRPNELRALLLAGLFNFVVLGSYYVIRPIRDDIAATSGAENLSWMFTGTLVVTLLANAAFAAIVARMPRRKFLPIAYRFFIVNLIVFYFLMRHTPPAQQNVWIGRAFFVWLSVFNLFVVTMFWAFMTDLFNSEQAKRLFAFIAVGGQLGAIAGPLVTLALVERLGAANLLLVAAAGLEIAPWCVKYFPAIRDDSAPPNPALAPNPSPNDKPREQKQDYEQEKEKGAEQPIGGGIVTAFTHVIRSPYLLGICGFMLLYAITSTFVYFQQADITREHFHDRAARTAFFAQLDLAVNTLTIFGQLFVTGRLLKWFGVGVTLAFLPVLSMFGFIGMGFVPVLGLLAVAPGDAAGGEFRDHPAGARGAFHRPAPRGQIQSEEFHRYLRVSDGRPGGRLVLHPAHLARARVYRDLVCRRAPRCCLVRSQYLVRQKTGHDGGRDLSGKQELKQLRSTSELTLIAYSPQPLPLLCSCFPQRFIQSASSLRRRPVRAMKTSSRVGLAKVTASISPGNASIRRAMKAAPSGCSIRTSSFRTLTSTPNDSTILSASEVASLARALMTSPPIPAQSASGRVERDEPAMIEDRDPVAAGRFLHQVSR